MEKIYDTWRTEKEGEIIIDFEKAPYVRTYTIVWRGQTIHLKIKGYLTEYGYGQTNIMVYNNQRFGCGMAKWKYMGGSTGNNIPVITSGLYKLNFRASLNRAWFYEEAISPLPINVKLEPCRFEILDTPESIVFEDPVVPKIVLPTISLGNLYSITLYEYSDAKVNIDNLAYFDADDLIIDYWRLTDYSEREQGIRIKAEDLKLLYEHVKLDDNQKAELLLRLHHAFKGKDCFEKITAYLDAHKITYKSFSTGEGR